MGNALAKIDVTTGEERTWHMPGGAVGASPGVGMGGHAVRVGVLLLP
jgi:hypothetical protein